MANSRVYLKSEAGGTTVVSRDTTAASGNLVLPASGNVASVDTVVTDNAIARYDGTTGKVQNSGVTIDDNNNVKANSFAAVGETKTHYISTDSNIGGTNAFRIARYANSGAFEAIPLTIDANGNVGIGTSSPQSLVHITKAVSGGIGSELRLHNNIDSVSTGHATNIVLKTGVGTTQGKEWNIGTVATLAYGQNPDLVFKCASLDNTAPVERMRIDSAGNVGIGVTPSKGKMHIKQSSEFSGVSIESNYNTNEWSMITDGSNSLRFSYNSGGINTGERMRVDANGNVGIGTTLAPWNSTYKVLQLSGGSYITFSNMYGQITANSYLNTSGADAYISNGLATMYAQGGGVHSWYTSPSGTAGNAITWKNAMTLDTSGNLLLTSGTGTLGYGTGAGGTVTQITSKSTAVTLNKPSGQIITSNSSLAAGASVSFTVSNTIVGTNDTVSLAAFWGESDPRSYEVKCIGVWAGTFTIRLTNITVSSLSDVIRINFQVIKGAAS